MSTRSLRKRLDRLTRPANSIRGVNKLPTSNFTIDPAVAKALRDDFNRLAQIGSENWWPQTSEPKTEEERTLLARMAQRASTISCPAYYNFNEFRYDRARLKALTSKEELPPWGRVEDGRGSLGHSATLRFPSPLIEPDVPD
jgi:hypothetical protein